MRIAILLLLLWWNTSALAQFSFSNRTNLLANQGVRSGAPMAVVDMNGDGLDDIVRLDDTEDLVIDYQTGSNMAFSGYSYGPTFGSQWSICVADVDGNGYNDILTGGAYNGLKLLKANATGTDYTLEVINILPIFLQGSNFADINNDGNIDIFACHDDGVSQAYRNNGSGGFTYDPEMIDPVSTVPSDNSGNYGSIWTDYDNDGDLDLYISKCRLGVSNPMDGRRLNLLFENDGNGNYTDVAAAAGLQPMGQSWATDFADIDNDGDLDAFVINHDILSGLYENNGFGIFTNITAQSGLTADLLTAGPGIQVKFADFDNDTYVDLLITSTGPSHRLFRNNGNTTFTNLTATIPTLGNRIHSVATGDLNNDGFVDLIAGFGDGYNGTTFTNDQLYMNNGNGSNNYLKVALQGNVSNSNGIGARLELYGIWGQQIREVRSGESYGIMTSLTQHFGIGDFGFIDSLVVRWPSGVVDKVVNPTVNQTLTLVEGTNCIPFLGISAEVDELTVSFMDETAIGAYEWLWDFGDGETSTEQNPTHVYAEANNYQVCLTVTGFCGDGQICQSFNVNCFPPQSVFGASTDGLTVNFTDISLFDPTEWFWTFGDATSSNEENPVHTFAEEGSYFVCLQASNNCGTSQFCDVITVGCTGTEADFEFSSEELSVEFTDLSTGGANTWAWDFGDGSSSTEQNPMHTFPEAGAYTVCLEIQSSCGQETTCETVNVSCPLPVAGFEFANQQLSVAFASDVSDDVTEYDWDFGDGGNSTEADPLYDYSEPGNYIVCLDATSNCGTTTVCQQVSVVCAAPQAAFIHMDDELVISFTDASGNQPEEWFWTFGDGSTSSVQNPQYEYEQPGNYEVCLEVTSVCGQNQVCEMITVNCTNPQAGFSSETNDLMVTLQDMSSNDPEQWLWTFGDGNSSTQQNPAYTYETPGDYLVCLTAFNACGSNQLCETVNVSCTGPVAAFDVMINQLNLNLDDSSANNPESWLWTFGDGSSSTAQNPIYTYELPGSYTVCLEVTSVCGTDQVCETVEVSCIAPNAAFEATANELAVNFTDQSSSGPTQWIWTFGDGTSVMEQNPQHTYDAPGTYEVCLTVSSVCGSNISCTNVTVTCLTPQAAFTYGAEELLLSFTDNSTNEPTDWLWTFGDGNSSTESNPVYAYETPGIYEVCLEAGSVCGTTQTCQVIEVSCAAPVAAFSYEASDLVYTFTDNSTNDPDTWLWDFGNGMTSTEANPSVEYETPGLYEICLTASSICGANQTCEMVEVNCAAPLAGFSFVADQLNLTFQDESENEPTEWLWTFGDGAFATVQQPNHVYQEPGVYEVCLEASSICGSSQTCQNVAVTCAAPQANFDTQADELSVDFLDISSNNPTEWLWDFGDGTISTEQNPSHVYDVPGVYVVCLIVNSVCGNTQRCESLTVSCAPPAAEFLFEANNLSIVFTDNSTNNPGEWSWNFGDGTTSTEQNPAHDYAEVGVYQVCLTVTSLCGSTTTCQELDVSCAAPEAAFSVSSNGLSQIFIDASTNNPTSWFWDFGDGSTSTDQTPIHSYETASNYTVCLTASSMCGADTTCQIINVVTDLDEEQKQEPELTLSPNPTGDWLQLELKNAAEGEAQLYIWSAAGHRLANYSWQLLGTENSRRLNVKELPAGLYVLQLETSAGTAVRRFVKE